MVQQHSHRKVDEQPAPQYLQCCGNNLDLQVKRIIPLAPTLRSICNAAETKWNERHKL